MGKALCCGEQLVLIAFTKIVLLTPFQPYSQLRAPKLCGEFSHHLRVRARSSIVGPTS
ncbi:hypothetical protein RND71_036877 [Anisodus tanguticus]|uniref:Uncharacterized protein n=1 Tax=Anisodus tanguticus TaxID=243964 RepID=A0AAE1R297_9SOLA|nr:hypothetical protein RND71_036877 [Anisodus tanguticus]